MFILDFFLRLDLYSTLCIIFFLNPLNFYSLKVTKFHGDSVKNKITRTNNYSQTPSLFRVKGLTVNELRVYRYTSSYEKAKFFLHIQK